MVEIRLSQEVRAPAVETFRWFTSFQTYPEFMSAVNTARQDESEPGRVYWIFSMAGMMRYYTTDIEVDGDAKQVTWCSARGADHTGHATVVRLDDDSSRLDLWLEFHPQGAIEQLADSLGSLKRRLRRELGHFATFVESAGQVSPVGRRTADPATPSDQALSYSERLADVLFGKNSSS